MTTPEQKLREELKQTILKMIINRLSELKEKRTPRLIVDRIDEVELKELHNKILKL